jgi:transcriptional regulator with XRE-family HTH domain
MANEEPKDPRLEAFGKRVARLRGDRPQHVIAAAAKMDLSTLSRIENGRQNPTLTNIFSLAEALGVSLGDLDQDEATRPADRPRSIVDRVSALEKEQLEAAEDWVALLDVLQHHGIDVAGLQRGS